MHVECSNKGGDDLNRHIVVACQFDKRYIERPVYFSSIVDHFVICFIQIFRDQSVEVEKTASDEIGNNWLEFTACDVVDII